MPIRTVTARSTPTVLLAGDSNPVTEHLSNILSAEGYEILCARDGTDSLNLARERRPDVALIGSLEKQVLETLRREHPEMLLISTGRQSPFTPSYDYSIHEAPFEVDEVREVTRRALVAAKLRRDNLRLQRELTMANQQLREYSASLEHSVDELRSANEKLKELNQSKASFISIVSHELRHPLTVAKGYLELITASNTELGDETRGFLDIAEQNLKNLSKMLDDLLDLSRMEAGHYHVERQPERVELLVNQTIQSMNASANAKGIKLESTLPENLPLVSADPLRVTQVLCNLVDNAIKFTPRDGRIAIAVRELPAEVELVVSDTGIGIPPDQLDKIFERFYQIKNPAVSPQDGAGLGLAICREIIRLHNGRIWAASTDGQGAQFHFTLRPVEN